MRNKEYSVYVRWERIIKKTGFMMTRLIKMHPLCFKSILLKYD